MRPLLFDLTEVPRHQGCILRFSEELGMGILISFVLPGFFCLVGLGIFLFGIKLANKEKEAKQFWKHTEGVVKNLEIGTSSTLSMRHSSSKWNMSEVRSSSAKYIPVYEYCVDSVQYTVKGWRGSSNPAAIKVGDRAGILYNPANPGNAILEKTNLGRAFMIVGAIFVIAGVVFFL